MAPSLPRAHASSENVADEATVRARILDAAFAAFTQRGYAATSTLEIATRAQVSKRELYALVGNKQQMLISCIRARATRLRTPADLPQPRDHAALKGVLSTFGAQLLREISDPTVIAVFRMAIAEALLVPEIARTLDSIGRETTRTALRQIMSAAQAAGLIVGGRPDALAEQFHGLLWGSLQVSLLLGVVERPDARTLAARANDAATTFLRLHSASCPSSA